GDDDQQFRAARGSPSRSGNSRVSTRVGRRIARPRAVDTQDRTFRFAQAVYWQRPDRTAPYRRPTGATTVIDCQQRSARRPSCHGLFVALVAAAMFGLPTLTLASGGGGHAAPAKP